MEGPTLRAPGYVQVYSGEIVLSGDAVALDEKLLLGLRGIASGIGRGISSSYLQGSVVVVVVCGVPSRPEL